MLQTVVVTGRFALGHILLLAASACVLVLSLVLLQQERDGRYLFLLAVGLFGMGWACKLAVVYARASREFQRRVGAERNDPIVRHLNGWIVLFDRSICGVINRRSPEVYQPGERPPHLVVVGTLENELPRPGAVFRDEARPYPVVGSRRPACILAVGLLGVWAVLRWMVTPHAVANTIGVVCLVLSLAAGLTAWLQGVLSRSYLIVAPGLLEVRKLPWLGERPRRASFPIGSGTTLILRNTPDGTPTLTLHRESDNTLKRVSLAQVDVERLLRAVGSSVKTPPERLPATELPA